ncbi:MAG: nucleotide exchange factor GrpE [bacterium]
MWSKIKRFFFTGNIKDKLSELSNDINYKIGNSKHEIIEEVGEIKKALRKQGLFVEMFKEEILERLSEKEFTERKEDIERFIDLSDAFFHLQATLTDNLPLQQTWLEVMAIVRQKIDSLLETVGLSIVCQTEVEFNPSLHNAVERLSQDTSPLLVERVIQPGYFYKQKLIRPAKVVVR